MKTILSFLLISNPISVITSNNIESNPIEVKIDIKAYTDFEQTQLHYDMPYHDSYTDEILADFIRFNDLENWELGFHEEWGYWINKIKDYPVDISNGYWAITSPTDDNNCSGEDPYTGLKRYCEKGISELVPYRTDVRNEYNFVFITY